jgi:hypothetical protein
VEKTDDFSGTEESEIRRVTKELVIKLWPLMGTSCQANEALLARLKGWLDEVRTWNIDNSGLRSRGVDMDPGTRQISPREGR